MKKNIITIDGPSGSGKGTVAQRVAENLGWIMLDSGALYRVLGYAVKTNDIDFTDHQAITELALILAIEFKLNPDTAEVEPYYLGQNIAADIRTDDAAQAASQVAVIPSVREALLQRQRDFYQLPGLVADGRDMGTIVFPEAPVKIFLTASAECRAERRYNQLINKGVGANMRALLDSIKARDDRDINRSVAPLKAASDALSIDSSGLTIDQVVFQVLEFARQKLS
jgi:CMP/dCMP kinase